MKLFLRNYGLVILMFLVLIGSRAIYLDADPPVYLSSSGGLFGDEAALAHNARNKALFGNWITDEFNPLVYNPILSVLEYLSFTLLGVGLIPLRLVNVTAVSIGFFLLFRVVQTSHGLRAASFAIFILGFNYVFAMYNRLGLNDTFLFLPMAMTLYFWSKGLVQRPYLILSGISAFACYITKASALYFVLACFFSLAFASFQRENPGERFKSAALSIALFVGGLFVSYILWYLLFFTPLQEEFGRVGESWLRLAMPGTLARAMYNLSFFTFTKYMTNTPVELLLCWVYVPFFLFSGIRHWKKVNPLELFAFLWLVGGYFALSGLNYRPLRYFVPLIPAMCLLAALILNRLWNWEADLKPEFPEMRALLLGALLLTPALLFWLRLFFKKCISLETISKSGYPILGTALVLSMSLFLFQKFKRRDKIDWGRTVRGASRALVASIVAVSFLINGRFYTAWLRQPQYTVVETSRELGRSLDQAFIAGLWSPLGTIENKHRCLYVGNNWFNFKDTFNRFPVTHLFLWDGNSKEELRFFQSAYPKIMEKAVLLKTFPIKNLPVRLIEIPKDNAPVR